MGTQGPMGVSIPSRSCRGWRRSTQRMSCAPCPKQEAAFAGTGTCLGFQIFLLSLFFLF